MVIWQNEIVKQNKEDWVWQGLGRGEEDGKI